GRDVCGKHHIGTHPCEAHATLQHQCNRDQKINQRHCCRERDSSEERRQPTSYVDTGVYENQSAAKGHDTKDSRNKKIQRVNGLTSISLSTRMPMTALIPKNRAMQVANTH
ncbi:unnamed protein product, partial [Ectocarpus fasciculatus]